MSVRINMCQEELKKTLTEAVSKKLKDMGIQVEEESLMTVPVSISGRHIHLSRKDMNVLFGINSQLTIKKKLSQPGQFAANEKVIIVGPKGRIENVRVLGPVRAETQIELSASDARRIGIDAPIRPSGQLEGTPGAMIIGPAGTLEVEKGCILAERHIHMTPDQALKRGLKNGQEVKVKIESARGGILQHVRIRVSPNSAYDMHIDTDESNAFQIGEHAGGTIII